MPKVWYPFAADHKHAGKYWEGYAPSGNLKGLQELSGLRTTAPQDKLIVTPEQVLTEEIAEALAKHKTLCENLKKYDKEALVKTTARTIEVLAEQAQGATDSGDLDAARARLQSLEREIDKLEEALQGAAPIVLE